MLVFTTFNTDIWPHFEKYELDKRYVVCRLCESSIKRVVQNEKLTEDQLNLLLLLVPSIQFSFWMSYPFKILQKIVQTNHLSGHQANVWQTLGDSKPVDHKKMQQLLCQVKLCVCIKMDYSLG